MNRYFSPSVANMGGHGDPEESRLIRVIPMIINLCLEVAENLAKDLNCTYLKMFVSPEDTDSRKKKKL